MLSLRSHRLRSVREQLKGIIGAGGALASHPTMDMAVVFLLSSCSQICPPYWVKLWTLCGRWFKSLSTRKWLTRLIKVTDGETFQVWTGWMISLVDSQALWDILFFLESALFLSKDRRKQDCLESYLLPPLATVLCLLVEPLTISAS